MISIEQAKALALARIAATYRGDEEIVIIDDSTLTRPYGWVFFYDSKRYLDTRNILFAFGGNGPVVVEHNGAVALLGSARNPEVELSEFELDRFGN